MKEGYKTTEFWISFVVQFIGLAVSLGILTDDEGSALTAVVPTIVTIIPVVIYILSRWSLKIQK